MFPSTFSLDDNDEEAEGEELEPEEQDEYTVSLNREIAECFGLFDKNKSGVMEVKYLEKALKCLGIFLSSLEMEDVMEILDKNGLVEFEEFRTYVFDKTMESDAYESLKAAFQAFDPDNEGFIPNDRLQRWMTTLGDPLTEKEAKELVKMGDPGKKGFVAYTEFASVLLAS